MTMLTAILSGFVLAAVAPAIYRIAQKFTGPLLALLPLLLVCYFVNQFGAIAAGSDARETHAWAPMLGLNLTLLLDGLSMLFVLLIAGIGALILVYAGAYFKGDPRLGRLFAFLLMFMSSMLGLVLADNLLALFVFWELTSISSYLLIGFHHERAEARAAALQALLDTGGGGLALLAGLLLLAQVGGSQDISALLAEAERIHAHALYWPILLLILAGAVTKSAQFPFHFWLPAAMEAPTPVSAYLHSATMVKAGVYLLARLSPVLGGSDAWLWSVTGIGTVTMLAGGFLAATQVDLKRILAYSTISALGTLFMLLGLGTAGATTAAVVFLLAHALYKGALFMVAGTIDHETGTRDARALGGLARWMPITAATAVLAGLSLAGLGPLLSFIGKELVFETVWESPEWWFVLTPAVVLAGALFVLPAGLVGARPFVGGWKPTPKTPHEAPPGMWIGPAVLALGGLLMGVWPTPPADWLLAPAAYAVTRETPSLSLSLGLWHGFNPALALSALSIGLGIAIYLAWDGLRLRAARFRPVLNWGPASAYSYALQGLNQLASGQTHLLQSGYLRFYLLIALATAVGFAATTLVWFGAPLEPISWSDLRFYEAGLAVLMLLATAAALRAKSRLAAIASLGVVGYSIALVFVFYGAPDVAMTQFLVETLTVILFVLVFYHLPEPPVLSSMVSRARDALIALSVGVVVTSLVLIGLRVQYSPPISSYYSEYSVSLAHGRNLVNVILVDFRALDTLGEISVLAAAGIGVFALLKLRPKIEAGCPLTLPRIAPDDAALGEAADQRAHVEPGERSGPAEEERGRP